MSPCPFPCVVPSRQLTALPGTEPVREEVVVQVLHLPGVLLGTRMWMSFLAREFYQASSHLLSHLLGASVPKASHWVGSLTSGGRDPQTEKDLAAKLTANPPPDSRLL